MTSRSCLGLLMSTCLSLCRDAADDSEGGFKSENNGSDAEDDMESPSKKAKIDGNAKIKIENAEHLDQDLTFRNSVIENLFGGDGQIDADGGLCV